MVKPKKLLYVNDSPYGRVVFLHKKETESPEHRNVFALKKSSQAVDACNKVINPQDLILAYLQAEHLPDSQKAAFLQTVNLQNDATQEAVFDWCLTHAEPETFTISLWQVDPSIINLRNNKYADKIVQNPHLNEEMIVSVSIISSKVSIAIIEALPPHLMNLEFVANLYLRYKGFQTGGVSYSDYLDALLFQARKLFPEAEDMPKAWFERILVSLHENGKLATD